MDSSIPALFRTFLWLVIAGAGLYLFLLVMVYSLQSKMLYFPDRMISATPASVGLEFESVYFKTTDGKKLHGWFVPSKSSKHVVLFCHGNAGNISGRVEVLQLYIRAGLSVFIFDYRGYGWSQGKPTEAGTYLDVEAAFRYLSVERGIPGEHIIALGRSLGGPIAAFLAAKEKIAALILDSAFTSVPDVAKAHYAFLPVRWLSKFKYSTVSFVRNVNCFVLVIHSVDDEVVPFNQGRELYRNLRGSSLFLELRGSHADAIFVSASSYQKGLQDLLEVVKSSGSQRPRGHVPEGAQDVDL